MDYGVKFSFNMSLNNIIDNTAYIVKFKIDSVTVTVTLDNTFFPTQSRTAAYLHYHHNTEIFFIADGNLEIQTENGIEVFNEGATIVPRGFAHNTNKCDSVFRFLFSLSPDNDKSAPVSFLEKLLLKSSSKPFSLTTNSTVLTYLNQIRNLMCENSDYKETQISLLMHLVFLELLTCNTLQTNNNFFTHDNIYAIENIVFCDYDKNLTINDVAVALSLSPRQVSRIIKKNFGLTFTDMVNTRKLQVAARLLTTTNMPVAEIINQLNFQTEKYFFVLFKKKYGCTPLQYRKQNFI